MSSNRPEYINNNLAHINNFCCLSEYNKLLVTKWLPDKDKLKLVDMFPPIVAQITTFDVGENVAEDEILEQVELFKKLIHVKKVFLPPYAPVALKSVILSGQYNKDIEDFEPFHVGRDRKLDYIENVIKLGGTSKVKNTFDVSNKKAIELIERYPNLNLNLRVEVDDEWKNEEFIGLNERISNMIQVLIIRGQFLDQLDSNIIFNSVKVVELYWPANIIGGLKILSRRAPNVPELTINFHYLRNIDAVDLISEIFKFEHLDTLSIASHDEEGNETFMKIVTKLITSTARPKLVNLSIESSGNKFKIEEIIKLENLRKFKSLTLVEGWSGLIIHIKNKTLKVKNVETIPLINILNKFNNYKIEVVEVKTYDKEYFKKCEEDVKDFLYTLPRNQNVQLYR